MAPIESARPAQLGALASASAQPLVVAITARALFDLEDSHGLFERKGIDAYADYQRTREDDVLDPGIAFSLVRKLLALNRDMPNEPPHVEGKLVEVILLSRNSADTGLRIFNSIQHHGLDIRRATFTSGAPVWPYIRPFGAQLFLSANPESVRRALEAGVAAATILPARAPESVHGQLRIAFDGDAVLFSDESERVYQQAGLEAFQSHERESARELLGGGPFKPFLAALHRLQQEFPEEACPIRTALVTARSAPAHERVIRTLREWNIRLDESFFLGGLEKAAILETFAADVFFDDQAGHCEKAREVVATGHVPHGVSNEPQRS